MRNVYGYHRVSTKEQKLDRGISEITKYCETNNLNLEKIFTDKLTGKNFDRPRYTVLKEDILQSGDTLIITEIDRLGRNKEGILKELRDLNEQGVRVRILEIPSTLTDFEKYGDNKIVQLYTEMMGNLLIELFAIFAQTEIEKKEKRQREGIEQMRARGEWGRYGRPRAATLKQFAAVYQRVLKNEITRTEATRLLGISDCTYYRYQRELGKQISTETV